MLGSCGNKFEVDIVCFLFGIIRGLVLFILVRKGI